MYKKVTSEELFKAISSGYNPVQFYVYNGELIVDLCINSRLTEGQTLFFKYCDSDQDKLAKVAWKVADLARNAWAKTTEKMTNQLEVDLHSIAAIEKLISITVWEEGETYRFTFPSGHYQDYICVTARGADVLMKKVPRTNLRDKAPIDLIPVREIFRKDTSVAKANC